MLFISCHWCGLQELTFIDDASVNGTQFVSIIKVIPSQPNTINALTLPSDLQDCTLSSINGTAIS